MPVDDGDEKKETVVAVVAERTSLVLLVFVLFCGGKHPNVETQPCFFCYFVCVFQYAIDRNYIIHDYTMLPPPDIIIKHPSFLPP